LARVRGGSHVRQACEVDDSVDAGKRGVPLGRCKIAERDQRRRFRGAVVQRANRAYMDNARLLQPRAQGAADESLRPRHQDLAIAQSHFQPCLLKNRTALLAKYPTCRAPFFAAPPPWWTMRTEGTHALPVTRLRRTLQSKSSK